MAEGLKCPQMKLGTGDDQASMNEFKTRLNHFSNRRNRRTIQNMDFNRCQMKEPKNVWDKFLQSVGLADNFRVHRLHLTS